jgi:large subunit ribosomal protein L2
LEINKTKNLILIEFPTKLKKWVYGYKLATLGRASNIFHKQEIFGKAGYYRLLNNRPTVRGVAMNPVDHPHGGRTKTSSPEVTPWGRIAKWNK